MAIDKSLKQHYEMQGGGPNYLGKQKMVKAPKKWQSSPDHEPAELAYITEKEKDILIDLDIYGSLNGKPNRGPSGIISLQGDLGGCGGGSSGSSDRGGREDREGAGGYHQTYSAPAPVARSAPDPYRGGEVIVHTPPKTEYITKKDPVVPKDDKPEQIISPHIDTPYMIEQQKIADVLNERIAGEQEDYDEWVGGRWEPDVPHVIDTQTRINEGIKSLGEDYSVKLTKDETKEANKFLQEYLGDKPGTKYYLSGDKIGQEKPGFLKTAGKVALGILAPQILGAEAANALKLWRGYNQLKKFNLIPKELDFKQQLLKDKELAAKGFWKRGDIDTQKESSKKLVTGDERKDDIVKQVSGGEDVVTETAKKFAGITDEQRTELIKRRNIVQGILDQGVYEGEKITSEQRNNLINYIQQISKFLVDPIEMAAHGGRIGKALEGRNRYI